MAHIFEFGVLLIMSLILVSSASLSEEFVKSNGNFAMSFYDHLSKDADVAEKSFVVSPYSIQTCGGLLFAGSGGRTARQMYNGLNLVSMNTTRVGSSFKQSLDQYADSPLMKILNKIYLMKGNAIAPAYQQVATKYFHSAVDVIDFGKNVEASKSVNDWVSENTNNKIKDLLSPDSVDADTKMLLLNVVHFKGEWENKFDVSKTKPAAFWQTPEKSVQVDMMSISEYFNGGVYSELSAMAVDIPFKGSDLSLFVIKPNMRNLTIHDLEEGLKTTELSTLFNKVRRNKLVLSIPKFKIETSVDLGKLFSNMGMTDMFNAAADFHEILANNELLSVSKASHTAVIEINEEGAEAAAATSFKLISRIGPMHFAFDQPFIYFIKNKANEVFFMGRFMGK